MPLVGKTEIIQKKYRRTATRPKDLLQSDNFGGGERCPCRLPRDKKAGILDILE